MKSGRKPILEYKCDCGENNIDNFYVSCKTKCKTCYNKCRLEGKKKRKLKNKLFAMEHLGGKCSKCGYSKSRRALEIHHLNSDEKDNNFASWAYWSKPKIIEELKNCVLLCSNCHREEHDPDC